MLGGMRAVTWTQIAQYIVLIIAYLTPIIILSYMKYGVPIPELTYGQAIQDITAREQEMLKSGLAVACTGTAARRERSSPTSRRSRPGARSTSSASSSA